MNIVKALDNKYIKLMLGMVGAVLLGAIGSGVWEGLLKPISVYTRDLLLDIISFGFVSYQDNIYKEIAKGFHEAPSTLLLGHILSLFVVITGMSALLYRDRKENFKNEEASELKKINALLDELNGVEVKIDVDEAKAQLLSLKKELEESKLNNKYDKLRSVSFMLACIIIATLFVLDLIKTSYVGTAITNYSQSLSIVSPYLSIEQKNIIVSNFAKIESRADYIKVIISLAEVAKNNNEPMPKFSIW